MKCVFLDRDGTLIRHAPYLSDPAAVTLLPTVTAGLNELLRAGCKLFLHTNQSGIGRGYFSLAAAVACNEAMLGQIGLGPDLFQDIRICPETPDQMTGCRKPSPAYAREIIAKYGIATRDICYLGDNVSDLMTGRNVGCLAVGVNTGVGDLRASAREHELQEFPIYDTFLGAANHVLDHFGRARV